MADKTSTLTFLARDAASGPIRAIHGAMGSLHGSFGLLGKAAGGIVGTLGNVVDGVFSLKGALVGGGLIGGLTAAANAAAGDEASTKRLTAAIAANVAGHTDYTAALAKTIAAGQRLAYSDDETRASLSRLVTSTHDVAEATRLNAIAMDFARLKNIDLATAANIIGKVHDGNVSILTRYGISVEKGATATQALAQIQTQSADQAQTYADTSAGGLARLKDAFSETVESIGTIVIPMMESLVDFANTSLMPAVESVIKGFADWFAQNKPLVDQVSAFVKGSLTQFGTFVTATLVPALSGLAKTIMTDIAPVIMDFATRVWERGLNKAVDVGGKLIGAVVSGVGDLAEAITSNEDVMNVLKLAADAIGTSFGLVADAISLVMDILGQLGDAIRANEDVMNALALVGSAISSAFDAAGKSILTVVDTLRQVIDLAKQAADVVSKIPGLPNFGGIVGGAAGILPGLADIIAGRTGQPRASGGPVFAGKTYRVGEYGVELFTPSTSGTITPAGSVTVGDIIVNAATDPDETARRVLLSLRRELTKQGMSLA